MASKDEIELLEKTLAWKNVIPVELLDKIADYSFVKVLMPRIMDSYQNPYPYAAVGYLIASEDYRADALERLKDSIGFVGDSHRSKDVSFITNVYELSSSNVRSTLFQLFTGILFNHSKTISPEQRRDYILSEAATPEHIVQYCSEVALDEVLAASFYMNKERMRLAHHLAVEQAAFIYASASNAKQAELALTHNPIEAASSVGFLNKVLVMQTLQSLNSSHDFLDCYKAFRNNPNIGTFLDKIEKQEGVPTPGRPSQELVDSIKLLRARVKAGYGDSNKLEELEYEALAYETSLKAKRAALARALVAEEAGTATNPFAVTELETLIEGIERYISQKAKRDFVKNAAKK